MGNNYTGQHSLLCTKCGHMWVPYKDNPRMCPKCQTALPGVDLAKHRRDYIRNRYVSIRNADGQEILVRAFGKRPYTGHCELCGADDKKRLSHHHWDNSNPSKGIWVCGRCHQLSEALDKNSSLGEKYQQLKATIEKEFQIKPGFISKIEVLSRKEQGG